MMDKKAAVSLCKQYIELAKKFSGEILDQRYGGYFNALGEINTFAAANHLESESPSLGNNRSGNNRSENIEAIVKYFREILGELDEKSE